MPCLVCGATKTVQSHLVPRALYRSIAGKNQHGFEATRFKAGVKYQAKGTFDGNILCHDHEDMLGSADKYGVEFIRNFQSVGRPTIGDTMWLVPNPKPELLVKFVAACIWRRGVSFVNKDGADLNLGPAEPKLRGLLFGDGKGYRPPLMVIRRQYVSQGTPVNDLMTEPGKGYGWGDNTWVFFAFGCEFTMKLNPYSSPEFMPVSVANTADPLLAWNFDPEEITDNEGFLNIAVNMFTDPKTGKARNGRLT